MRLARAALLFALAWPAALAAQPAAPPPATAERSVVGTARVEAIDRATREVVLRTPEGRVLPLLAGPEVRNFDQIRVGDTVRAEFREAVMVEIARPGTPAGPDVAVVAGRAAPGQRPAAGVADAIRVRVRVIAVNPAEGRVTFEGPRGIRSVVVTEPAIRNFVAGLAPGDEVDVTIAEALAVVVERRRFGAR